MDNEIGDGEVTVSVDMVKEERMMDLHFTIGGLVKVACNRCNDLMDVAVEGTERLIVKFGDGYREESEDVQIIPETAHQFDLSSFIYEYIHLLVPIRRVHQDDAQGNSTCDPVMIQKLNELNNNTERDPRWDALSQLKKSNKS